MKKTPRNQSQETMEPHWIEWFTGLVSALLVLALIGWVVYESVTQYPEPPDLAAVVESETTTQTGHRIEFRIVNHSNRTAAAVVIEGELVERGTILERHELVIDYVPAQSNARGAFLFSSDPAGRQMRIRPRGYVEP